MKRKMYTEEQIAYAPRQTEAGTPTMGTHVMCAWNPGSTPSPQRIGIYSRTRPHSPRPHIGSRSFRRSEHQ